MAFSIVTVRRVVQQFQRPPDLLDAAAALLVLGSTHVPNPTQDSSIVLTVLTTVVGGSGPPSLLVRNPIFTSVR